MVLYEWYSKQKCVPPQHVGVYLYCVCFGVTVSLWAHARKNAIKRREYTSNLSRECARGERERERVLVYRARRDERERKREREHAYHLCWLLTQREREREEEEEAI